MLSRAEEEDIEASIISFGGEKKVSSEGSSTTQIDNGRDNEIGPIAPYLFAFI